MYVNYRLTYILVLLTCITNTYTTEECITPNKELAQCISVYDCYKFIDALITQNEDVIRFVRESQCGEWDNEIDPKICCGSVANFIDKLADEAPKITEHNISSNMAYCGYQHFDDYIYTESGTGLDEFPWLAIILYEMNSTIDRNLENPYGMCSGTLINGRYVLTAAYCVTDTLLLPKGVRLGEYNVETDVDCVRQGHLNVCSDPVRDIGIEEIVVHPEYNSTDRTNDIALIRLIKSVTFSDYIRPLCLPLPNMSFANAGEYLTTTGFGRSTHNAESTKIKKRISTELLTKEECEKHLLNFERARAKTLSNDAICTKDDANNTVFSCSGDIGAPIMISRKSQWHIEGIVSWNAGVCGPQMSKIHTKVANYLDWIQNSIKPWQEIPL